MKPVKIFSLMLICLLLQNTVFSFSKARQQDQQARKDSLFQAGIQQYSEGRYAEAVSTLLSARPDSSSPKTMFFVGMSYASLNDFQNAKKFFQAVVERDSTNVPYRSMYARFLIQSGALVEGRQHYETAFAFDSTYTPVLFQLGLVYNDQRMHEEAADKFRRIVEINPRDFLSYYYLGNAMVALGKQDSARVCLRISSELNPNFVPAIAVLGSLYYAIKDYAKALELYQNAFSQRPNNADYANRIGLCYRQVNDYPNAISFFKKATEIDSLTATYAANLGHAYFHENKHDSSVVAYEKAIVIDNQNPLYLTNLALVYQQMDSVKLAARTFQKAVAVSHPEDIGYIYYQLGSMYYNRKQYKEAVSAYQRSVEFDPSNVQSQFFLGFAFEQLHDASMALKNYQKYLTLTSNDTTKRLLQKVIQNQIQDLQKKK
ncbi:MAG: tetratricopeptide repeat protein [Ignavibacteriales bacterium]|nr:tetratricopeptide repeat protein [Ignavibacteriales bacterium]